MEKLRAIVRSVLAESGLSPHEIAADMDERMKFVGQVNWQLCQLHEETVAHDVILGELLRLLA